MNTLIIRPKYPYGKPQIYLPYDLLHVAARARQAGIEAKVLDLNLHDMPSREELKKYDSIGIGVFGVPYVPSVLEMTKELQIVGKPLYVGGKIIEKLSRDHHEKIFGNGVWGIHSDSDLASLFDVAKEKLGDVTKTTIMPELLAMDKSDLNEYLKREFSVFVSQGCKFSCNFCAADKARKEVYRDLDDLEVEVDFLSYSAKEFGIDKLRMYLSCLDLFQTPEKFEDTLQRMSKVKETHDLEYDLRGLSCTKSFVEGIDYGNMREVVQESGLSTIGFGVDGTDMSVWKAQGKFQNDMSEIDSAFSTCKELSITPEILMIMGFHNDNLASMAKNSAFVIKNTFKYGAVYRPYVAKEFSPGNAGWPTEPSMKADERGIAERHANAVEYILDHPELLSNLDYAMFASKMTHPKFWQRALTNAVYGTTIAGMELLGRNATYPLMPGTSGFAKWWNRVMPFDK